MSDINESAPPLFGVVDLGSEHGLFTIETHAGASCRLTLLARTERGYPRRELAAIPGATWKKVAPIVQKELLRGMVPEEQGSRSPSFKTGENALSPLITRELAVLLWALMEDGEGTHIEALVAGWRQLAREERWWLYARASNPAQRIGHGWRHALLFALTDPADTRTAPRLLEIMEAASVQKKTSSNTRVNSRKQRQVRQPVHRRHLSKRANKQVRNSARNPQSSKRRTNRLLHRN